MPIDRCLHSLFGVSKAAADLLVQEYGRYFDMPTVCFRGGCLTGPNHAGAKLHGFLSYLMRCTVTGEPYTVFGYGGKQVRDNIHSADLVRAFAAFHASPRAGAVYNIGGGPEATARCSRRSRSASRSPAASSTGTLGRTPRIGDHRWWISDLTEFRRDYPEWGLELRRREILREIYDANVESWTPSPREALRRHPGPQRGGLDRGRRWPTSRSASTPREIDYEILVVDDASSDGTASSRCERSAERTPAIRCRRSHNPPGFGFAVRAGLDVFEGDAVAIVMADGSDGPEDIVDVPPRARGGLRLRVRLALRPRRTVIDYPRLKLVLNRWSTSASACSSGTATTTRRTPSRPTGAR